ncbi:MAG: dTMP kinase [Ignavibacteria bacterium]|nr:dTMP kinase [Ignavibacteria bacterium]
MFITFEGIDLCGKSTQARMLVEYLQSRKKKVIYVREPGGTKISEKIRHLLLDKDHVEMEYVTEFLLFSASRYQLTNEIIIPHLKKNFVVICDRYFDSSTAYQGFGGKIDVKDIKSVNKFATSGLKPDITFLLNITPQESFRRKKIMNKAGDRIEEKTLSYYKKVVDGYMRIVPSEKKRFKVIDGTKNVNDIHQYIVSVINRNI